MVGVRAGERERIEGLANWRGRLGVEKLFLRHRGAGRLRYALAKRGDGRCVFLGEDNLCVIHREFGLEAKPLACQMYPFVLTPVGGKWHVGLRFDCPAVVENAGEGLARYGKELARLGQAIETAELAALAVPEVWRGQRVRAERFEQLNEMLVGIAGSDAMGMQERLLWLWRFVEQLRRVRWGRLEKGGEEDFAGLVGMLKGGTLAETTRGDAAGAVSRRGRGLLGQVFWLLCQPAEVVTGERVGIWREMVRRLGLWGAWRRLRGTTGPLPAVREDWPECDLAELEGSFGDWPGEVQEVVGRWLTVRLAGLGYCGRNFYGYSMVEGAESLLLGAVTMGWVMRVAAVRGRRRELVRADAVEAVLTVDGNLGYGSAFSFGPARLRLRALADELGGWIERYCG